MHQPPSTPFRPTVRTLAPALAAMALGFTPLPLLAETLAERLALIEERLAASAGAEAVTEARELLLDVTAQAGFGMQNPRLTVAPATGFGVYEPVADPVFPRDAPVHAYVELHGYSLEPDGEGTNRMTFDVVFALHDENGNRLTDVTPMGAVEIATRARPADTYIELTYRVTGAEGRYVLWTEITDRPSGRSVTFELPVEYRAAADSGLSK